MENKIVFFVDTNIWLERLLDQEKSEDVRVFHDVTPRRGIYISDFSLHSIALIMSRYNKINEYLLFINGEIMQLGLTAFETIDVINNIQKLKLDFDDSYQYTVSKKYNLEIVTFDNDFNKSGIETLSQLEAIKLI